jgi:hypothetical protein
MSITTKIAAVALAAVTLGAATFATTDHAEAKKWGWGPGIGLGLATGALIGAGLAANSYYGPSYVYAGPYCKWVPQYDAWGNYMGKAKVCG